MSLQIHRIWSPPALNLIVLGMPLAEGFYPCKAIFKSGKLNGDSYAQPVLHPHSHPWDNACCKCQMCHSANTILVQQSPIFPSPQKKIACNAHKYIYLYTHTHILEVTLVEKLKCIDKLERLKARQCSQWRCTGFEPYSLRLRCVYKALKVSWHL